MLFKNLIDGAEDANLVMLNSRTGLKRNILEVVLDLFESSLLWHCRCPCCTRWL